MELKKYEGKNKEEILKKILKELNCNQNDLFLKSEFIEGKLFKSPKYIVSVVTKKEIIEYISEYIQNLSRCMKINIESEILESEDIFKVTLVSDQNAILIGKEGRTLNSIQLLLKQSIKNKIGLSLKINVDVANYKVKKLKNIEYEVKKIINEVQSTKITAALDPMNSYERRFVHNLVSEYKNLTTESIGEGRDRRVTIKYKEN
jgi:spoIIIJ-associated protein